MIDAIHLKLRAWADWRLSPSGVGNLGYGKNILLRIQEGKGELLPSGGTVVSVGRVNFTAQEVEEWMTTINRRERYVIKTFYLSRNETNVEKAARLRMTVRTLYTQIDRLHQRYESWLNLKLKLNRNNL